MRPRARRTGRVPLLAQHLTGPAALVAIGYVDPGNWATDLAGGSLYAYALLPVVVVSSLAAMLLQTMSAHLGIASGIDLAEATRAAFPRMRLAIWTAAELAAIATDLAEVLGSALALQLLFRIPLATGVLLTGFDVALLLAMERRHVRLVGGAATLLFAVVAAGLAYELLLSRPDPGAILRGLVPSRELVLDRGQVYAAVGILGATIMPHNLYLHSSLVSAGRDRSRPDSDDRLVRRARSTTTATVLSLSGAMILNTALVVLGAAVFHGRGHEIVDLREAHRLLAPLLGSSLAPVVFAVALLAAGQSASISGTLAGQSIMAGLLGLRWPAWQRRLVTRACTMVPAMLGIWLAGEASTTRLLVGSQVLLSLALPFAMIPLILLASDRTRMGPLRWRGPLLFAAWGTAGAVILANGALVVLTAVR